MTDQKRYISPTEQAKMIRASLRESLPGTKFSVRQSRGGHSITVTWTDGPTTAQVQAIVGRYAGGGFDGMQDLQYSVTRYVAGEPVLMGATYINAERRLSARFITQRLQRVCDRHDVDAASLALRGSDSVGYWLDISNPPAHPRTTWEDLRLIMRDLERYSEASPQGSRTARTVGTHADVPHYVYG